MAEFPLFAFTSQEDWKIYLAFKTPDGAAIPLSGRSFEMPITPAVQGSGGTLSPQKTLTMAAGGGLSFLTDGSDGIVIGKVDRDTARGFARGEYTSDLIEVTGGQYTNMMPVRVRYSDPAGLLAYLPRMLAVAVNYALQLQPIVTPLAVAGPPGKGGATIITGTTPPVPADGNNGDFFIEDRSASNQSRRMYGPKLAGAWPATPWNIQVARISDVPGLTDALTDKLTRKLLKRSGMPTTDDIPADTILAAKDTSTGRRSIFVNDGGTIVDLINGQEF